MSSKFFVYAGRRWRELDTRDGNLEGWGRARFVYLKQGRLNVARRGAVLRALRALGTGCGVAAKDGLQLSKYVPEPPTTKRVQRDSHMYYAFSTPCKPIQNFCRRCANDDRFDRLLKPDTSHVAIQCVSTANASIQVSLPSKETRQIAPKTQSEKPNDAIDGINVGNLKEKSNVDRKQVNSEGTRKERKRRRSMSSENAQNSDEGDRDQLKELIIEESDVQLLRQFLATDKGKVFKVDLKQFDKDDAYKEKVFYAINPLVSVERCPRIKAVLNKGRRNVERSSIEDNVSLIQFMTVLGLRTVGEEPPKKRYKTRSSITHNDKENKAKSKYDVVPSPKESAKVLREDNARRNKEARKITRREELIEISSGDEFAEKTPVREARASRGRAAEAQRGQARREYSREEDAAILRWVEQGGRARCVNGNKLWQLMQADHRRATGIGRSWHSLRNRYLRHLLPALPRLAPAATAQRLRADARTGELKARKTSKENSLLVLPKVQSAWAMRPRPSRARSPSVSSSHSSDATFAPSSQTNELTGTAPVRRTPRFSEVLRRYGDRSSSSEPSEPLREAPRRRLYTARAAL